MTSRSPVEGSRSRGAPEVAAPRAASETRWALPPGVLLSGLACLCVHSRWPSSHTRPPCSKPPWPWSLAQAHVPVKTPLSQTGRLALFRVPSGSLCEALEPCNLGFAVTVRLLVSLIPSRGSDGGNRTPRSSLAAGRHGRRAFRVSLRLRFLLRRLLTRLCPSLGASFRN